VVIHFNQPEEKPGLWDISENIITIEKGKKIAQIMFDTLSDVPDIPYNKQANASFNNEYEYLSKGGISNVTL